jgi:(1->4)-alpha-D-glucan 1-alpha-D-glucosylmutase
VITLATRLPVGLAAIGGWRDTTVELATSYVDQLTGRPAEGEVALAELLIDYPVALLAPSAESVTPERRSPGG